MLQLDPTTLPPRLQAFAPRADGESDLPRLEVRLLALRSREGSSEHWQGTEPDGAPSELLFCADGCEFVESLDRWAALEHPRIAPPSSWGEVDGIAHAVWPGAEQTLAEGIDAGVGTDRAQLALLDVADALEHAHAAGVVHGGLGPAFVGLYASGARVAGFGMAGRLRTTAEAQAYTAPELLDPRARPTRSGDLYALGMLALLALYGDPLPHWVTRDPDRLLQQLDPDPDLAEALRGLLAWNPAGRVDTPLALVDALLADPARLKRLTRAALDADLLDQAERLLDHGSTGDPRHQRALRRELARRRLDRGDAEEALRALRPLTEHADDPTPIWLEMAEVHADLGQPVEAARAARHAWETHRDRSAGEAILRLLVRVDEEQHVRWAGELAPHLDEEERTELCIRTAERLLQADEPDRARDWLTQADPTSERVVRLLGTLGSTGPTLDDLLTGEPTPEDRPALLKHWEADRHGPPARRAALARQLLATGPHAPSSRLLAQQADAAGRPAMEHLQALVTHSDAPADHLLLAVHLEARGDLPEALEVCRGLLDRHPHHVGALEIALRLATTLDRHGEAAELLSRLGELRDDGRPRPDHHRRLASLWSAAGQPDAARQTLCAALERSPDEPALHWSLRRLTAQPQDLPVTLQEALACLLLALVDVPAVRRRLALEEEPPWQVAVALVDALGPPTTGLFDRLLEHAPDWEAPIRAVRALADGEVDPPTSAQLARWSGLPTLAGRRLLRGTLAEGEPALDPGPLLDPGPVPGDHPPVLVVGVGVRAQSVPIERSCVLSPTTLPDLPGMLQVVRSGSQIYLAVDEGTLKLGSHYARELRAALGEQITWRGVPLVMLAEAPPEDPGITDLELFEEVPDEVTEPNPRSPVVQAGPVSRLPPDLPALVWEQHGLLRGIALEEGLLAATLPEPGVLALHRGRVPDAVFTVERAGPHCLLSLADERQDLEDLETFALGDLRLTFYARGRHASPADRPTVEMERQPTETSPWLLLDDGTPGGRAIRVHTSPFRMGRARSCELHLAADPLLSRVHCCLERVGELWYAVDRASANGTRVNGLPVSGRSRLEEGDRIELGRTLLLFSRQAPDDVELEELPTDGPWEMLDVDLDDEEDTRIPSAAEVDAAMRRSRTLASEDAIRMLETANAALSVLLRALDETHGPDRGRTELQVLVDASPRHSLIAGLAIRAPSLPTLAVLTRLDALPPNERRRTLEQELLDVVRRTTEHVQRRVPPARMVQVQALLDAVDHRRRLRF